ncbi:MAG: hypothetical protein K6G88_09260 [Lachnospiraceae bacterium]|nr:hypothetical protein [Lachnospiraceae bacterium]
MAIQDLNYFSHALMHPTTVKVVTPHMESAERTVYFLHGVLSDAQNVLDNLDLQKYANQYNTAFVIPSCGNSFYIDHGHAFGNYGRFVGNELVSVTRQKFGLSNAREDTCIAGFSMGGYGAIRNGLKYYNNFGSIIAMSPACLYEKSAPKLSETQFAFFKKVFFDDVFKEKTVPGPFDENYKFLLEKLISEKKPVPNIYMTCSGEEDLLMMADEFSQYLNEMGVEHKYVVGNGAHDWKQWTGVFADAMEWLDGKF